MRMLCLVCALLLAGCVSTASRYTFEPLGQAELAGVAGQPFRLELEVTPTFLYYTGGDKALMTAGILFGPIGAILGAQAANSNAEDRGAALAAAIDLSDPTKALAERVASALVERYGAVEGESGLVLTVETESWQLRGDEVMVMASVRLGPAGASEPLASAECRYRNTEDERRPSAETLLANDGNALKQEIDKAIASCARRIRQEMFVAAP